MANASQNSGLDRTARLLDLVPYLSVHQGISLADLAQQFSLSISQLTEDLTTLWMCGLPGYTALELMDLSFDNGYVSISNAETLASPRALNRDEVLALVLGLQTISESLAKEDEDISQRIGNLISKLSNLLSSNVTEQVQAGTAVSTGIRRIFEIAIASRLSLRITYHSHSRDAITDRVIHPLEFSFDNDSEYIYAYCENSKGYRTFKLDRVISAEISEEGEPARFNDPIERIESPSWARIVVTSRKRDVAERFGISAEKFTRDPQSEVEIKSFSPDWAIREIMSLGGEVTLESPEDLRESLLLRSKRALGGYI